VAHVVLTLGLHSTERGQPPSSDRFTPHKEISMNLTRVLFIALAIALPASWTVAKAEDAPAAEGAAKKEKKGKKAKKEGAEEKKDEAAK